MGSSTSRADPDEIDTIMDPDKLQRGLQNGEVILHFSEYQSLFFKKDQDVQVDDRTGVRKPSL